MELFGYAFDIGNKLGYYSFLSLIVLIILYFVRPKPFKKIIPSLIFLEKGDKRLSLSSFFRRFVKDWLIVLQFFLITLLCIAALDVSTQVFLKKINQESVFIIDASASSKAKSDGKMLFDMYKDYAKNNLGVTNSIIVVKNAPEVLVKQTNPVNAYTLLSTLNPSDALSNIWDAMMISSEVASPKATIYVLSDFVDTSGKDLSVAKKILEAKGYKVEFISMKQQELVNAGIIKYVIEGSKATVSVKNYNGETAIVDIPDINSQMQIPAYAVEDFSIDLHEGMNEISILTDDAFRGDDQITLIIPKKSENTVLFATNQRTSYVLSALEAIKSLDVKKAEPPIVPLDNQKIVVLDNVDYSSLLPGTTDKIRSMVEAGSTLIITAQNNIDSGKLGDLLPVELGNAVTQETTILNSASLPQLKDFNFGLSSKYYVSRLKNNSSLIIAEANDKESSPVIVLTKYGRGNILYYGIFDDYNPFKISTQYPLFWISTVEILTAKEDYSQLNLKIGDIVYGDEIKTPSGKKSNGYITADELGIYKLKDRDLSVNLLNPIESDLNMENSLNMTASGSEFESQKVMQSFSLLPIIAGLIIILLFFEVYILKKRGDI